MEFYQTDVQILRQSQSKLALDFLKEHGVKVTIYELQFIVDVFVELCLRPMDDDLKKRVKSLDKWIKQKKGEQNNG